MRYILDDEGYVKVCSKTEIVCESKTCTEYTGNVPDGYSSIEEWATNANIREYKIVDGQLVHSPIEPVYEIGHIYASSENVDLTSLYGGEWELINTYNGGELIAYANVSATGGTAIGNSVTKPFSDASIGTHNANITSYVDDVLTYSAGAPLIKTKNIVGFVEAEVHLAGLGSNNLYGMWWQGNANTLPQGVSLLSGSLYLSTGPIGYSYGGTSNKYCYKVAGEGEFFVNPSFYPYGGSFTPGAGGTYSCLSVKVFAKAGKTYVWKRVA